jgi:hypothetical protein
MDFSWDSSPGHPVTRSNHGNRKALNFLEVSEGNFWGTCPIDLVDGLEHEFYFS